MEPYSESTSAAQIAHLLHGKKTSRGWIAKCPAHEDRSPSLSISIGRSGQVLVHCFAGCTAEEVLRPIGLKAKNLFPESAPLALSERRAIEAARAKAERLRQGWAAVERAACGRVRDAMTRHEAAAEQLATLPDDSPDGDRLAELYHLTLDRLRAAEVLADRVRAAKVRP